MALDTTIEISGMKQLADLFKKNSATAGATLQKSLLATQALLAKYTTKATAPWRTGFMIHTFQFEAQPLVARYFPTAKYAIFVHEGTGIYGPLGVPIVPKKANMLYWEDSAGKHFSKSVKGQRPNPFMPRIAAAAKGEIDGLFADTINKITKQLVGQ